MELIDNLTKGLGINEDQAKGASGLLFKLAKNKLGSDFTQVENVVPEVDDMIKSAPESGGIGGSIGGLISGLGGSVGKMGDMASLASGFKKLGLDKGMVAQVTPMILNFVQSKGGDTVKTVLEKVLK